MSDDLRISLGIEPDKQSESQVKRLIDQVERQFDQFTNEIEQGNKKLDTFFKGPSQNHLEKSLLEIEEAAEKTTKALKETKEAGDKAAASGKSGGGLDVRGSSGTISTAAGAFGSVTGQAGLTQLGDIASLTEQTSALGEVVEGLGPKFSGLATVAPVAGVAVAAVAGAVALYNSTIEEQTQATRNFIVAQKEITDLLNSGSTSDDVGIQILEIQEQIANAQDELAQNNERYAETYGNLNAIQKIFNEGEEDLYQRRKEQEDEIAQLQDKEKELTAAREAGRFAANDLVNQLIEEAELKGDLAMLEAQAATASKEANQARLESLEIQRLGIATTLQELEALQASGEGNAEAAEKINNLRSQMEALDAKSQVLSRAIASAGNSADTAAKSFEAASKDITGSAKKAAETQVEEAKKTTEKVTRERGFVNKLDLGSSHMITKTVKAQQDAIRQAAEAEMKAFEEAQEREKQHQQRLLDLTEDFYHQREDALFEGDFRQLFQLDRNYASDINRLNRETGNVSVNSSFTDKRQSTFNFPQGAMSPDAIRAIVQSEIQTIVIN